MSHTTKTKQKSTPSTFYVSEREINRSVWVLMTQGFFEMTKPSNDYVTSYIDGGIPYVLR